MSGNELLKKQYWLEILEEVKAEREIMFTSSLHFSTKPECAYEVKIIAVSLQDAKEQARAYLRSIILPTDRPGVSVRWATLKHLEEKLVLLVHHSMPLPGLDEEYAGG